MAVDPRYKSLKVLTPEHRQFIRDKILREIQMRGEVNKVDQQIKVEKEESEEPPVKKSLVDCLMGDVIIDITNEDSVEKEVNDYFAEVVRMSCPLDWWRVSQVRFPNVALLARKYLTIPGTSIPSERVFSVAGLTVTKLRASLDPDTVNEILFLHKHMKKNVVQLQEKLSFGSEVSGESSGLSTTESDPEPNVKQELSETPLPALPSLAMS